jgi:hypothetical protein
MLSNVILLILAIMAQLTLELIKGFLLLRLMKGFDCCLGNAEWCLMFPSTTIYHLPMMYSSHAPILVILNS